MGGWVADKRMQIKKMKTNGVCVEEDVEKMGSERRKEYPPAHPTSKKEKKKEERLSITILITTRTTKKKTRHFSGQ